VFAPILKVPVWVVVPSVMLNPAPLCATLPLPYKDKPEILDPPRPVVLKLMIASDFAAAPLGVTFGVIPTTPAFEFPVKTRTVKTKKIPDFIFISWSLQGGSFAYKSFCKL
jgi:hypothetical protein